MIDQLFKRFATFDDVLKLNPRVAIVVETLDISVPALPFKRWKPI
jgi:hypothetical protein